MPLDECTMRCILLYDLFVLLKRHEEVRFFNVQMNHVVPSMEASGQNFYSDKSYDLHNIKTICLFDKTYHPLMIESMLTHNQQMDR